jgi:chemotaxis protein methyltransferase CheR
LVPSSETDCDALLLRAAVLTNRGDLVGAEEVCGQVLRLDGLNPGAHYLSALGREHAGDRGGALREAKMAAYLDSSFAMPHLQLGFIAKRTGDPQTARHEFGLALTLLAREDPSRILLFGGGFNREALIQLCRSELRSVEKERHAR